MSESDVIKVCREYLDAHPDVEVVRVHSGTAKRRGHIMRLAPAGTSDFICCIRGGRYMGVEAKRSEKAKKHDNGQGTLAAQSAFARRVRELGGVVLTVSSVDELKTRLDELLRPGPEVFGG
jgi:hypothetical protein